MFTDMVGYSALSQRNEALALELLNEHRRILRNIFALHGGHEIEAVGDGFFVECSSALAAARCAVDIQRALHDRNASQDPERRIQVRIGLHLGDVIAEDTRVHGDGVNIAARIEPLAEPGGICVSEDVARQILNKIELPLQRLGKAALKNIKMPVEVYRLVVPWEHRHLPGWQRLAFRILQHRTRYALTATAVVVVLGVLAGGYAWQLWSTPGITNNRLAVLPFVSLSPDHADEYFADGITEELISRLSRVQGLEVIARTSIATYKGTSKKVGEIARELNVGTILEGSVRKDGGNVRITAQLINAANDAHLWSQDYDRELKDIFAVQAGIAQHVTDVLAAKLAAPNTSISLQARPQASKGDGTKSIDAYNAYLKGRFYYNKATVEGLHKAIEHFDDAIRQDPSYALAYAGLADAYGNLAGYEGATAGLYSKVRASALKALELDESLAEAHTSLGIVKAFYDYDLAGAGAAFRRALELNPNSAMTLDWYSYYLLFFPRWDEAIAVQRRAVQLDPLALIINTDLGWVLEHAGRWDEGIEHLRKALELDPANPFLLGALGLAYLNKGMYPEALATLQKRIDSSGRDPQVLSFMAQTYARSGDLAKALQLIEEAKDKTKSVSGQSWEIASAYRALATRDKRYREDMFRWLQKAYDERSMGLVFVSSVEWQPFRNDPDMVAFRKKLGLTQ